jgi:hypothetical protein
MKKLAIFIFVFVLLFSIFTYGQTKTPDASISSTEAKEESAEKTNNVAEFKKVSDDKKETSKKGDGKSKLPPEKANPVNIPLITTALKIDGNLDEEVWQKAAVFKDFIQTSPGDNIAPSKPTEAYVLYDEKNLYIGFKAWDDKDKIRASVAKRDQVTGEDNVRVWLDTYDDQRRAYILAFNPFGIQQDGIYTEGQGNDFSVDIVMESKGKIYDWGWSVEIKIPFKSLRYSAGPGKHWGFNLARNIDRFNDEFDAWIPQDRNISGFLIQSGKITGLDQIKTERTLEIVPSVTFSQTGKRVPAIEIPDGRFVNQPLKTEIGVNLKYTITPNITLDAAINPDFAEIEADAPVVTANQRFPIFFSEKRPFFLEGAEIFQSPIRVFHSRSIIDPDLAVKLTGKINKTSFGILAATDNAPGNYDNDSRIDPERRPFIDEYVDKNALFAVLRLKQDFGSENNIGFFGTARVFPEDRNFVGGFDGKIKVNSGTVLNFQVVGSHTRQCFFDPQFDDVVNPLQAQRNGEICGGGIVNGQQELGDIFSRYRTGNGIAYNVQYDYTSDTFGYVLEAGGQSEDYRSDAGFNRRTNTNYLFGGFRKSTKSKPKAAIVRANWFNGFSASYDNSGRSQYLEYNTNLGLSFQKNIFMNLWGGVTRERIYEEEFGLARTPNRGGAFFGSPERGTTQYWFGGYMNQQVNKKIFYELNVDLNYNSFDFDFGAGPRFPRVSPAALADPDAPLDPGSGKSLGFYGYVQYKPIDPLNVSLSYNKSILTRNDTEKTAFDVNIMTLRATYQFTRFIYIKTRWDYNTLSTRINGQTLFGWNPNPGTAFYLGYNDNLTYNGFNPYSGNLIPKFGRDSRTFFIRMSYLFRKSF